MNFCFKVAVFGFLNINFCLSAAEENISRVDQGRHLSVKLKIAEEYSPGNQWNRTFSSSQDLNSSYVERNETFLEEAASVLSPNDHISFSNAYEGVSSNAVYVGPEVLVDVDPEGISQIGKVQKRHPPDHGFTWERKMEIVQWHNVYRSNVTPPAGDMAFMEWDEELSRLAQLWADNCRFMHGFPDNSYPGAIGQNLYMGWDPSGLRALLLWYEERRDYDFKEQSCTPLKQCGHYTQMVWSESALVGCAMKRCGPRKFFTVCHYSPAGNVVGESPYLVAKPCSQCPGVNGTLCKNNLCVTREQCDRQPEECENAECTLKCHNCGQLDPNKCRCRCAHGWDSPDCSKPCSDSHERCGKSPGWPTKSACYMNQNDVAEKYCRKMCDKCNSLSGNNRMGEECCAGAYCPPGQVLDLKRRLCSCQLLCPGSHCYESLDYSKGRRLFQESRVLLYYLGFLQFLTLFI